MRFSGTVRIAAIAAAALGFHGCGAKTDAPSTPAAKAPAGHKGHEHHAPHGGALVALGEEFAHLEFVLDAATGELTAYALDGEAENAVRLKQPSIGLKIKLKKEGQAKELALALAPVGNPLTGETLGDTSEYHGGATDLANVQAFDATLEAVEIRGQSFAAVAFNYPKGNE